MTSSRSWLPEAAARGVGRRFPAADVNRSAGLFPSRVVATGVRGHLTYEFVRYRKEMTIREASLPPLRRRGRTDADEIW
jgi:hypothetical protein